MTDQPGVTLDDTQFYRRALAGLSAEFTDLLKLVNGELADGPVRADALGVVLMDFIVAAQDYPERNKRALDLHRKLVAATKAGTIDTLLDLAP